MNTVITNPRAIRNQRGLNQQEFWSRIGVTKSGGSRYESGRRMPRPVRELFRLVHIEQIDLETVNRQDLDIVAYLKDTHPDLYESLKRATNREGKAAEGMVA